MMNYIRSFFVSLKNLFIWLPIIWRDRDHDYYYIYEILKFKLKKQSNFIGRSGCHTSSSRDSRNMMICVSLMEKLQSEYYEYEYSDYHDLYYDCVLVDPKLRTYRVGNSVKEEHYDYYILKYPTWYKRSLDRIKNSGGDVDDKSLVVMTMGILRAEKCKSLLFKIMETEIGSWWD